MLCDREYSLSSALLRCKREVWIQMLIFPDVWYDRDKAYISKLYEKVSLRLSLKLGRRLVARSLIRLFTLSFSQVGYKPEGELFEYVS